VCRNRGPKEKLCRSGLNSAVELLMGTTRPVGNYPVPTHSADAEGEGDRSFHIPAGKEGAEQAVGRL